MKTKIAFIAAALAVVASPLRADIVESNLTFALKFYANTTDIVEKGNFETLSYQTATIKNADIIEAVNFALFEEYSTKSKIIRRDEFDEEGALLDTSYLIRDKESGDIDITDIIDFDSYFEDLEVEKSKVSTVNGTGTYDVISTSILNILFDLDFPEDSEEIEVLGIDRQKIKVVSVKQTGNLVELVSLASKVHGYGYLWPVPEFDDFWDGILEGTIKVSGAKVLPPDL